MSDSAEQKESKGIILLVEDDQFLVQAIRDSLQDSGYELLVTQNIKEALLTAEQKRPIAVLLDIFIPKYEDGIVDLVAEQGYDFLRAAKADPKIKDIPVIMYTNLFTMKDRKKCAELGADAYIFKCDVSPKEVLETIEKVVQIKKATQA